MRRLGIFVLAILVSWAAWSRHEFGVLEKARAEHSEFFEPGAIHEALLDGEVWYAYCGESERCFSDESESELFMEAEVQAKLNLYRHFLKEQGTPKTVVTVKGARRMYEYADGRMRYVVMGVPKSNVTVQVSDLDVPREQIPAKTLPPASPARAEFSGTANKDPATEDNAAARRTDVEARLTALRNRLKDNPDDFKARILMARIFAADGKEGRANRNFADGARMAILQESADRDARVSAISEAAEYEEKHGAGALALKHYSALRRIGGPPQTQHANAQISQLLLRYR